MSINRIQYFDELRGFVILFVVFCHHVVLSNETVIGNIFMTFAWTAVPCFFMVTGGIMHRSKEFSWKKWGLRVVKVYTTVTIWKFLYLLFYMTINTITFDVPTLLEYLFFEGQMSGVDIGPMWFMSAYLQALFFYPISHLAHQYPKIFLYVYILLFSSSIGANTMSFIGLDMMNLVWTLVPFGGYINMLSYFILGAILLDNREKIKECLLQRKLDKIFPIGLLVLGVVLSLCAKYTYTGSFEWGGVYLHDGYLLLSTMMMSVGLYLCFSMELAPKITAVFNKLGQNTMGIYYLHYPMLIALHLLCDNIFPAYKEYFSFALNVTQTVIVIVVCVLITFVAKRIPLVKGIFS